ncbi:MAG: DMT family transporter [Deltaproteobacteria bacterium]|nr:DMT family transporter [Deltaproteobacteria bacterium]
MSNPLHIISFLLIALFWGGSFFSIGVAVKHWPPFFCAFLRVFSAFLLIAIYLLLKRKRIERPAVWLQAMGTGAFLMGIPWLFLFWGEKHVQPALAAILNSTVPIFTVLLTPLLTPSDKLSWNKWAGVWLGFAGVAVIFFPGISTDLSWHLLGLGAILIMAICYAIGLLWMRRISRRIGNASSLFYQALSGSLILGLATLFFELPGQALSFSWPPLLAALYLGVFSTAAAWLLFFGLVRDVGSVQAAAVTLLVPLVAILLDFFFWEKFIHLYQAFGAVVILLAVFLINKKSKSA